MIWALTPLLVFAALICWFALSERSRRYEQIITLLERDRDAAKSEAKLYRNLLMPALARAEGASEPKPAAVAPNKVAAPSKPASKPPEPKSVDDIWAMRIPYREKFKLLMRLTNSKQRRTDALASALEQQKPIQEKPHVNA